VTDALWAPCHAGVNLLDVGGRASQGACGTSHYAGYRFPPQVWRSSAVGGQLAESLRHESFDIGGWNARSIPVCFCRLANVASLAGVAVASGHESRIRIGQQNPLVQLSLNGYFQPRTCVCSRSEQFSFNRTDENRPNRRVSRSDGTRPSAVGIHRASGDIAMLLCQYCCVL
jgi:hypothetical protein